MHGRQGHAWFYEHNWDEMLDGSMAAPYIPPPPKMVPSNLPSGHKHMLSLEGTMTNPNQYGYWPGW